MPELDLVFRSRRAIVAAPGGSPANDQTGACVGVRDGRIVTITAYDEPPSADRIIDLGEDEVLLPGLVDTHVHVNEPGRTEWEGFATATRAAAAGGITAIIDMPLNSIPPTIDVAALAVKRDAARGQCHVDVGFWGGAVPSNLGQLRSLHDAGVFGFKCFLADSGVEEFPPLDISGMRTAMTELARFDGLLLVHAEDARIIASAPPPHGRSYADFLTSRPCSAELAAIGQVVAAASETGVRAHVLHLSDAGALPILELARREAVAVTVETCPHYLSFAAEDVADGATEFKCCPPIREAANRDFLWSGLQSGVIDCVVSDHSPSTPEMKGTDTGDFGTAWGGISSLQLGLPAIWTAARDRGASLGQVIGWMAERPADIARLTRKGRIAIGYDADLVAFAPDAEFVVDPSALQHRHPLTPYAGKRLSGMVRHSWVRGRETGAEPIGELLTRGKA